MRWYQVRERPVKISDLKNKKGGGMREREGKRGDMEDGGKGQ